MALSQQLQNPTRSFDAEFEREHFPILNQRIHGLPLAYLDNGATTQKPVCVIDAMNTYYREYNANVHRGVHTLSEIATEALEHSRAIITEFINAKDWHEIVFTKGTTDGLNLLAHTFATDHLHAGDEVLISAMEHHSNIVPWQLACERTGATLRVIPMDANGVLDQEAYARLLSDKTKVVSLIHVSNALGTVNPIKTMTQSAHARGIPVIIDGAQSIAHMPIDVQDLECDFFVFSGHKVYGPTGVGVLYGKREWLERLPPYQGGGDMIRQVTFEKTEYNELPYRFEAGTPPIAEIIGLGKAVQYLDQLDFAAIKDHESELLQYLEEQLGAMLGIRIIGHAQQKAGICSFTLEGAHPHDLGTVLDGYGVAVRAGHHCAMPVMDFFKVPATVRASIALYNTPSDIEQLIDALMQARSLLL